MFALLVVFLLYSALYSSLRKSLGLVIDCNSFFLSRYPVERSDTFVFFYFTFYNERIRRWLKAHMFPSYNVYTLSIDTLMRVM